MPIIMSMHYSHDYRSFLIVCLCFQLLDMPNDATYLWGGWIGDGSAINGTFQSPLRGNIRLFAVFEAETK